MSDYDYDNAPPETIAPALGGHDNTPPAGVTIGGGLTGDAPGAIDLSTTYTGSAPGAFAPTGDRTADDAAPAAVLGGGFTPAPPESIDIPGAAEPPEPEPPLPTYYTAAEIDALVSAVEAPVLADLAALRALPTADEAPSVELVREVVTGTVVGGDLAIERWLLAAGTNADNGVTHVRPDDYDEETNAKVWVRVG